MIMKYKDRKGNIIKKNDSSQFLLDLLYGSLIGKAALKPLTSSFVSETAGKFCDSAASRFIILPFIRKSGIDLSEYRPAFYRSFNDFFTRKIRPECRPVDRTPSHLISPCDAKLSVCPIDENSIYSIKNSFYNVNSLLRCRKLSDRFDGGVCMIFRLEVDDCHRYIYIDNGRKSANRHIKGFYHTVKPVALENVDVYHENTREMTLMHTENFGDVMQIEVGAMMVGRIKNHDGRGEITRGKEKGMFKYGGSTIVLLFEAGKVVPDEDILRNSQAGYETIVKMGEKIGQASHA